MIEYIKGTVTSLTPTTATIETRAGMAYLVNISVNTYQALQQAVTSEVRVLIHENVREDAWTLYGFADERERALFRALIGVSGVGAGTARVILSGFTTADLEGVIARGDVRSLKNVKGIGAKTAERIIVDLRDKVVSGTSAAEVTATAGKAAVYDEATAALVMLGYTRQQSQKALKRIFAEDPGVTIDQAIRRALAMM